MASTEQQPARSQTGQSSSNDSSNRIYILGIGNIGKLFAHALAIQPNPPPITILLHRASLLPDWEKAGRKIDIITDGVSNTKGNYDVEVVQPGDSDSSSSPASSSKEIQHLVLATKATHTATAIGLIKDRLTRKSEVLFAQNGMGTVDTINSEVFPDVSKRPRYLTSVNSHGVYTVSPFSSVHAGFGTVTVGNILSSEADPAEDVLSSSYLARKIVESPLLTAKAAPADELFQVQLEKLVVNAMMNPLTAIFNIKNGELWVSPARTSLMRLLLSETSKVISSLPELQRLRAPIETTKERFSTSHLEEVVRQMTKMTAKNTSSMLQDVRAQRETEIDQINGWIVRRGKEFGISCPTHEKIIEMVKARRNITDKDLKLEFNITSE